MSLDSGCKLGPYEIESPIGAGGMGEVYRARDTRLDRSVAVKVLPASLSSDPQFRERFDREARAISQLAHPNICTQHDVGEYEGTPFLVAFASLAQSQRSWPPPCRQRPSLPPQRGRCCDRHQSTGQSFDSRRNRPVVCR
jgi:serine/threonine protein kinase